jgi:hypothetical protein
MKMTASQELLVELELLSWWVSVEPHPIGHSLTSCLSTSSLLQVLSFSPPPLPLRLSPTRSPCDVCYQQGINFNTFHSQCFVPMCLQKLAWLLNCPTAVPIHCNHP